jgi:hypothetical protein
MTSGLFSALCPQCGTDLHVSAEAEHACLGCGARYTILFGFLVSLDEASGSDRPPLSVSRETTER